MFRIIDLHLREWVGSAYRKPLLLRGARQVGKTFAVRKVSNAFTKFVEINFEETPQLRKIFDEEKDLDPARIIRCRPRVGGDPSMWQGRCTASNGSPPTRGRQL